MQSELKVAIERSESASSSDKVKLDESGIYPDLAAQMSSFLASCESQKINEGLFDQNTSIDVTKLQMQLGNECSHDKYILAEQSLMLANSKAKQNIEFNQDAKKIGRNKEAKPSVFN